MSTEAFSDCIDDFINNLPDKEWEIWNSYFKKL
jgi:hypothetical protein